MLAQRVVVGIAAIFIAFVVSVTPVRGGAEELFQSRQTILFNKAHASIVYLEAGTAKGYAGCTGAVVASTASASTIMTAAHCVAGMLTFAVYLNEDVSKSYAGTVLKAGTPDGSDVAFLQIGVGHLPVLRTAARVDVGANVVIIGYPRAAIADFKERHVLVARQDQTAIASVVPRANGLPQIIDYQYAVTDHGDSGAPVIEIECSCIVGVVHGEYDEKVGRTDYAMGPQEILAVATSGAPQIALSRVGTFVPNPAPAVAQAPLHPAVTRSPAPNDGLPVEALLTVAGPPELPQWTGWGTAAYLRTIPTLYAQSRCLTIGREYLWQIQAANVGQYKVSFRHRLTDANGVAFDPPLNHSIDNDGAYLFRPQQLDVPCTGGTAYHHVSDVRTVGNAKPPRRENLVETSGGPQLKYKAWDDWQSSRGLPGVRIAFRCIDLGDDWFGWEVAFSNKTGSATTFDFDIEPGGAPANYRHRYRLPTSNTIYFSDVIALPIAADCKKNDVTMHASRVQRGS